MFGRMPVLHAVSLHVRNVFIGRPGARPAPFFGDVSQFLMHLTLLMLSLDRVALHCEHACIGKCFDHQVQLTFTWYAKRLTVRMLFLENVSTMKLMLHVMADKFINMTSDIHR